MLPHKFKIIGSIIVIISGILLLLDFFPEKNINNWMTIILNIGLSIFIFSKEKINDERIEKIRLRVFKISFAISVFIAMFFSILNMYLNTKIISASTLMTFMGVVYIFTYQILFIKEC